MEKLIAWFLVGLLTYLFIKYGTWSKDVFQYNLRVEGTSDKVIHVFAILFALGWPLWWFGMFPISLLIGRHDDKWFEMQKKLRENYTKGS